MSDQPEAPLTIWAVHMPFKKDGAPSLGSFGATVEPAVIMKMETWETLCREIEGLAKKEFRVGEFT